MAITALSPNDLTKLLTNEAPQLIEQHYGNVHGLCAALGTSERHGLLNDAALIEARRKQFGPNSLPNSPSKSLYRLMWEAAQDLTLLILVVAAIVSLVLAVVTPWITAADDGSHGQARRNGDNVGWIESLAIMLAVVAIIMVKALSDWSKEKQFRALQSKLSMDQRVTVVRGGAHVELPVAELVVGDVVYIQYGDVLPADGLVLHSNDLSVDESSLTGESDHVRKSNNVNPVLLSGTRVMEGRGTMLVVAVGLHSRSGTIYKLMNSNRDDSKAEQHQSVLQAKLTKLAVNIGKLGVIAAVLCFAVLVVKFCIQTYGIEKQPFHTAHLSELLNFLINGIIVLVIAVPEGLPLAVTLALAYSARVCRISTVADFSIGTRNFKPIFLSNRQKMMSDNNLVRHIDACETMGNATTICCDKTGTLTTNRMTVTKFFGAQQYFEHIPHAAQRLPSHVVELLGEGIAINSNYTTLVVSPLAAAAGERPTQIGNRTECALLGFVLELGIDYQQLRASYPASQFLKVFTFSSSRKAMATLIRPYQLQQDVVRVHVKGASELVVAWCKFVLDEYGHPKTITEADQQFFANVCARMADDGLRTIAIAYKDVRVERSRADNQQLTAYDSEQNVFSDLVLLGIAGIEDPVRPEVPDAIAKCQKAGITVRMLTGDNINTARLIAYKCGIIPSAKITADDGQNVLVLEGSDFNARIRDSVLGQGGVRQELLDRIWPRLRVLARSQPEDKYTLVKGIIDSKLNGEQREVVAVTGDGTNDGPALKIADVGFAMGITGTGVAKEASDIIITDDNFTSIVKAVMWGRNIYDSISKFIQFQLTINVVAVAVALISAFAIDNTPLKAVQMLWVNLIQDTLAALALATESPSEDLLKRKPYGRLAPLISPTMLVNIVVQSVYQITVILLLLYFGPQVFSFESGISVPQDQASVHFTLIYTTFVLMTLAFEIYARKVHGETNFLSGIWRNKLFIAIWIFQLVVQVATVQIGGFVGVAMQTTRLPLRLWGWSAGAAVGALLWQTTFATIFRYLGKSRTFSVRKGSVIDVERGSAVLVVNSSIHSVRDAGAIDRVSSLERLI